MNTATWTKRAQRVLPGGGFGNFDHSVFLEEGKGARVWDEQGNEFVDYLIGSGPMLLGHGNEEVLDVVHQQLGKGMTFFANNTAGVELAEVICNAVPCAEQVRYLTSGGEADMYALRLARAYTGKAKILKFEGGYHGMSAEAQMSLAPTVYANYPNAVPDSAGIPNTVRDDMVIAPFNDPETVTALLDEYGAEVAAIIVEPLQRIIPAKEGFLAFLREECTRRDIVLVFDEIVTGFRLAYGGAQEAYGVVPDLCTLGKIIGGGFPLAAVTGKKEIMRHFDVSEVGRERYLMQLGTLSGNPIAAMAGLKTLEILRRPGSYDTLQANGKRLKQLLEKYLGVSGHDHQIVGDNALFDVLFTDHEVYDYRSSVNVDKRKNSQFNTALRANGVLKSPSKIYPCLPLTEADFELTEYAIENAVAAL